MKESALEYFKDLNEEEEEEEGDAPVPIETTATGISMTRKPASTRPTPSGSSSVDRSKPSTLVYPPPPPTLAHGSGSVIGPFPSASSLAPSQQARVTPSTTQQTTTNTTQPNETKPWAKLVLVRGEGAGAAKEYDLCGDTTTIGRAMANKVVVSHLKTGRYMSRNHIKITRTSRSTFELEDLKSMNGTLVNGLKVSSTNLKHGDYVMIGPGLGLENGEYFKLPDGRTRDQFKNEQEWKTELREQFVTGFVYRFEILDQAVVLESLRSNTSNAFSSSAVASSSSESSSSSLVGTSPRITASGKSVDMRPILVDNDESNKRKLEDHFVDTQTSKKSKKSPSCQDEEFGGAESRDVKFDILTETCKNELSCGICQDLLVDPTLLQCGHTFCKKCLYDWLAKNKTCPFCREQLRKPSCTNKAIENILNAYVMVGLNQKEKELRLERIAEDKQKFREDMAKLEALTENAKSRNIKFLCITDRWRLEEKRTFKNGVKQYFGQCREGFCAITGLTNQYVQYCTNDQLIIACDNLEIPLAHTIVGQEVKTMRRVVDFDESRQRLSNFLAAGDNLFFL